MSDHDQVSDHVFHILLSLVDGPMHGYGILQEVETRTGGSFVLGSGTLYSAIKRMLQTGWVEAVEVADRGDPRRKFYALTDEGRRVVTAEARRLEALVAHARAKALLTRHAG